MLLLILIVLSELSLVGDQDSELPDLAWDLPSGCQCDVDLHLASGCQHILKSLPPSSQIRKIPDIANEKDANDFLQFVSILPTLDEPPQLQIDTLNIALKPDLLQKVASSVSTIKTLKHLKLSLVGHKDSKWPEITWDLPAGCETEVDLQVALGCLSQHAVKSLPPSSTIHKKVNIITLGGSHRSTGGQSFSATSKVQRILITDDTITSSQYLTPLSSPVDNACVVTQPGTNTAIIVGGQKWMLSYSEEPLTYDIIEGRPGPSLPTLKYDRAWTPAAFIHGTRLYCTAGNSGLLTTEYIELEEKGSVWQDDIHPIPESRVCSSFVSCQDRFFILGGCVTTGDECNSNVWEWSSSQQKCKTLSKMIYSRQNHTVATDGNHIWVFGDDSKVEGNTTEMYDIINNKWQEMGKIPHTVHSTASIYHDRIVYIIGGVIDDKPSNQILAYHVDTDSWETLKGKLPSPVSHHTAVIVPPV